MVGRAGMKLCIVGTILACWVPSVLCASLLGVGMTKSGGLEIADASFSFLSPNDEGLTRLNGKGLAVELDMLNIRTSNGQLTMTPTSIAFKKGAATWQSLYYDERLEFRRNNDILLHVIAAGKAENFQYRFLGTGYFNDVYLDQVVLSKALGMLCRADKSLAAQKRLDSTACRAEMTEMHMPLTQQLEMIGRIVSSLTDLHLGDNKNKANSGNSPELLRQAKQEMTDGLIKEIDRRLAEANTNLLRTQAERNRTMFEQSQREFTEMRQRIEGISIAVADKLKEIAAQAGVHERLDAQLQAIVKVTVPKMVADSEYKLEGVVLTHVAAVSQEMQQTVATLNDTWHDHHRRQRDLVANGLNTTLTLAHEFTVQTVNASLTRVVNASQVALSEAVSRVEGNVSAAVHANLTAMAQHLTQQWLAHHENTSVALATLRQDLATQGQQQNDSLVAWQRHFNVASVDAQIDRAIDQWNATRLHPAMHLVHHTLREQQTQEALAWRTQLSNTTFVLNDTLRRHTDEQVERLATTVHVHVASNLSALNETLQQSLHIWHRTWHTTKQHIDDALAQTQQTLSDATTRNLTAATVHWQTMERQLHQAMASLDGHVTQTVHNLTVATQALAQSLVQNMSTMAAGWATQQTQLQQNVTQQLQHHEALMTRALQDDAHQRHDERANYTWTLQQRFIDHETRWVAEQARWSNQTDAALRHVHHELRAVQADVANTTTTWMQRWVQVHADVAVLQQRTVDDRATLQSHQTLLQTQTTQLALLQQTQTDHVVPSIQQWQQQWKNWTEATWPRWQQETLLWRQDIAQRGVLWTDATKQCQGRVDGLEKELRSLRETVGVLEKTDEQRRRDHDTKEKHAAEEMKRLRSELDAAQATVAALQREQEKLKAQQERMQETLLNQVLLLVRTQQQQHTRP